MKLLKIRIINNPCNRYISLWCLYLLQGTLYAEGSIISQSIILLILLMSVYHVLIILQEKHTPQTFRYLILLTILYTIHGLFLLMEGGGTAGISNSSIAINFLQSYYISVLPIFSFYYYARKEYLTVDTLRPWIIIFMLIATVLFYKIQRDSLERAIGTGFEDITNNAGYIITALIPCVFAIKRRWKQYCLLVFCTIFTMFAMKRGAILTGGVAIVMYLYMTIRHARRKTKYLLLITTVIISMILTIIAGLIPAKLAAKKDPVEALRTE